MAMKPLPSVSDLINHVEAWDLFQQALEPPSPLQAAFNMKTTPCSSSHQATHSRGKTGGRGSGPKRLPHCQICRINGHYANACPDRFSQSVAAPATNIANIAEAFSACSISDSPASDWYLTHEL